jgi:hypothetical protein
MSPPTIVAAAAGSKRQAIDQSGSWALMVANRAKWHARVNGWVTSGLAMVPQQTGTA